MCYSTGEHGDDNYQFLNAVVKKKRENGKQS